MNSNQDQLTSDIKDDAPEPIIEDKSSIPEAIEEQESLIETKSIEKPNDSEKGVRRN